LGALFWVVRRVVLHAGPRTNSAGAVGLEIAYA